MPDSPQHSAVVRSRHSNTLSPDYTLYLVDCEISNIMLRGSTDFQVRNFLIKQGWTLNKAGMDVSVHDNETALNHCGTCKCREGVSRVTFRALVPGRDEEHARVNAINSLVQSSNKLQSRIGDRHG